MNERGKSDGSVVPENPPNNGRGAPRPAEEGEGRDPAKGNPDRRDSLRAQNRERLQQALDRIREAARRDTAAPFTTLWHHVYDVDRLREAFLALRRDATPGVDGVTWQEYRERREENLHDLSARLRRGAYRAKPVMRAHIPKPDGRMRPIGKPALEDKIVQRSAAQVMGAVFEEDFVRFSYGFRPGRSQHDALDALYVGIVRRRVNWVIDADIRGFFDAIDHEWLMKFVAHRIADPRVLRHVKKWLNAGVMEEGEVFQSEKGTPQGGSISPLLANIFLHYVFDLWARQWRKQRATGDMIVVRYADDIVLGFQSRHDAERFRTEMGRRLAEFGLELHPDKTRLIEFGRFAAKDRDRRGNGKPPTFDFLGFTHICGKDRHGRFKLVRQTIRSRMTAKLHRIKADLRSRMHYPLDDVGKWLSGLLHGYYRYQAVPDNSRALRAFRTAVMRLWWMVVRRRGQKQRFTWHTFARHVSDWLPRPRILHPYPTVRLYVRPEAGARCGSPARRDLRRGS